MQAIKLFIQIPEIFLSSRWITGENAYKSLKDRTTKRPKGIQAHHWPVDALLAKGYGLATAHYGDLEPHHLKGWKTGVWATLESSLQVKPKQWTASGAWAWGLKQIMDYQEGKPALNAPRVIIKGHSRLGKAVLWAAANNKRSP